MNSFIAAPPSCGRGPVGKLLIRRTLDAYGQAETGHGGAELVCQASQSNARSRAEAIATLNANVIDTFNEYGVQIMSPHYLGDPALPKVVPRSAWYAAPAKPEKPAEDERSPKG